MRRLLGFIALASSVAACSPDLGDAPFRCSKGGSCPDGYVCNPAKICVEEGRCPVGLPGCPAEGCGDGTCADGETCSNCEADCGKCNAGCGDGTCGDGETCSNCEADCGQCPAGCGNGVCDANEDCNLCEPDCGPCGSKCGNGKCESGETVSNCPADCSSSPVCGNGSCEPGETTTSCPADCKSSGCTEGQTQCKGTDSLEYCEAGIWKTDTCAALCAAGGFDYEVGCEYSASSAKELCICGDYGQFGDTCSDTAKCATGLSCGYFDSATTGFCTKACTSDASCTGGPFGTMAQCVLTLGTDNACGFICDILTVCPSNLTCDFISELCKP